MKVFLGIVLLASAATALVDEKPPTAAVPESKKTDLLITANGQTIKVNADGRASNPIGLAANRFRLSHHSGTRRMEGSPEDPISDGGSGDGDTVEEPEVLEFEAETVDKMIGDLQKKVDAAREAEEETITMSRGRVEEIIEMLKTFQSDLEEESSSGTTGDSSEDYTDPEGTRKRRRRRSRSMRHRHHRRNQGFVRHHRVWGRRQSVVHGTHFTAQKRFGTQRIVVNP